VSEQHREGPSSSCPAAPSNNVTVLNRAQVFSAMMVRLPLLLEDACLETKARFLARALAGLLLPLPDAVAMYAM
jgi:hypothetical protein